MLKRFVTRYYFLFFLRIASCCECNLNITNINIEKRQLDVEDLTTTEVLESITDAYDFSAAFTLEQSTVEINETTTESHFMTETIIGDTNRSHIITEEKNTTDNVNEISEKSSEVIVTTVGSTEFNIESKDSDNNGTEHTVTEHTATGHTATENVVPDKTEIQTKHDLWKKCRTYKNGDSFDLKKMSDVWQVVYYQLPNKLKCFKLHIKFLKPRDQERYGRVFGNFNDTVHWNRCFLEITSSEKDDTGRRHFLQGTQDDKGVMDNVIIDEDYFQNTTYLTLHREAGDQWLVINNLLVMRDCENGDFVVFTRFPRQPRKVDIMKALSIFGVDHPNGTMACNIEKSWLRYDENVRLHEDGH